MTTQAPIVVAPRRTREGQRTPGGTPRSELQILSDGDLKKLWLDSRNLNGIGVLWTLSALLCGLVGLMMMTPTKGEPSYLLVGICAIAGLLSLLGAHSAFFRPQRAKAIIIICCTLGLINFPAGTIAGIFGILAVARSPRLFGEDRLRSGKINAEWKERRKQRRQEKKA